MILRYTSRWMKKRMHATSAAFWQRAVDELHHEKRTHKARMAQAISGLTEARYALAMLDVRRPKVDHAPGDLRVPGRQLFCLIEDRAVFAPGYERRAKKLP
jgi:hypothetical protein